MQIQNLKRHKKITIGPGEYYATDKKVIISTLLGSCVSACLYDPYNRIIGMNHFMLSGRYHRRDVPFYVTDAGRYGVHSMELLINEMMKLGADRSKLHAKAFGGGSVLMADDSVNCDFFAIGDVNAQFIMEFLQNEKIPLISSDLGGVSGRVIYFDARDFSVHVRKIKRTIKAITRKEEQYWKTTVDRQKKPVTYVDLWYRG